MPQLHFYVPKELADRIRHEAESEKLSISRYLAKLVEQKIAPGWPEGYFDDVVGGWQGEPLERSAQGIFERRDALEPHRD